MTGFLHKSNALIFGLFVSISVNGCLEPEHCQLIFDAVKHIVRHICK